MLQMTSRDRVAAALRREQPDRVPHCELGVDRALAQQLLHWGAPLSQRDDLEQNPYTLEEEKAIASFLKLDNVHYVLRAPVYAQKVPGQDGRLFYGEGMIHTRADMDMIRLPDPTDERLYENAKRFVDGKGDYSCWFVTRVGIFPTMLGMGTETFSVSLFEDRGFVEAVLDRYVDWTEAVAERVQDIGFDVFVSTDDMAFKSGPFFSPQVFREVVLPRFRRVAAKVRLPWVIHSDGNLGPFVEDLIGLGIAGMHPNEKGAMDIVDVKRRYGDRVCILGNLDLNILGLGTEQDVEDEVRWLIRNVGPGGGYIITSGNSLAGYLKPENVVAFTEAVQKYGAYPLHA